MTPENHTLFDWHTLDEFSDLKPANKAEVRECKQLVCSMLESELSHSAANVSSSARACGHRCVAQDIVAHSDENEQSF